MTESFEDETATMSGQVFDETAQKHVQFHIEFARTANGYQHSGVLWDETETIGIPPGSFVGTLSVEAMQQLSELLAGHAIRRHRSSTK